MKYRLIKPILIFVVSILSFGQINAQTISITAAADLRYAMDDVIKADPSVN